MTTAALSLQLGISGTFTDRSGSCSSTSATIANPNPMRSYMLIQNPKTNSTSMWVNFTLPAQQNGAGGSLEIASGGQLEWKFPGFVSTEAVNVIAAGSQVFVYKEA